MPLVVSEPGIRPNSDIRFSEAQSLSATLVHHSGPILTPIETKCCKGKLSLTKYGSVLSHFYFILITAKHLG